MRARTEQDATRSDYPRGVLQMSKITMIGTGSDGAAHLWNGQMMQQGNHRRWFFDPALGFPELGFELFRRPSGSLNELLFDDILAHLQAQPSSTLSLGNVTVRTIRSNTTLAVDQDPLGLHVTTTDPIQMLFGSTVWYVRVALQPATGKHLKIQGGLRGSMFSSTTVTSSRVLEYSAELDQLEF